MRELIKQYTVSICKENGYIQIVTKDDDGNIWPCELEFLAKAMIMDSKHHCPASAERIAEFAKMSDEEQGDRLKCAFERGGYPCVMKNFMKETASCLSVAMGEWSEG